MAKQFNNGILYIYLRGSINNKHINIQFRRGSLVQSYGKSNTPTPSIFSPFVDILSEKIKKYPNITWTKEKYDYLTN
jgi:hypothetical protein